MDCPFRTLQWASGHMVAWHLRGRACASILFRCRNWLLHPSSMIVWPRLVPWVFPVPGAPVRRDQGSVVPTGHPRNTQCPVEAGAGIAAFPVFVCLVRLLGPIRQDRARITIPVHPVPEGTSHHPPVSCIVLFDLVDQPVLRLAQSPDQSGFCIPFSKQIRICMLFCWTSVSASIDGCCASMPSRRKPQNHHLPRSPAFRGGQACG